MYSADQLRIIAQAYIDGTGISPATLGAYIADNEKLIIGLLAGRDCLTRQAGLASDWFSLNWPPWADSKWPAEIRREAGFRRKDAFTLRQDLVARQKVAAGRRARSRAGSEVE